MNEATCRKCGLCCYAEPEWGRKWPETADACIFLDRKSKLCLVYPMRHKVQTACMTVTEAFEAGHLPADCPYIPEFGKGRESEV